MKESITKTQFEMLKQIFIDLGNINHTLALMNINKIFPSKEVKDSVYKFLEDRKGFLKIKDGRKVGA